MAGITCSLVSFGNQISCLLNLTTTPHQHPNLEKSVYSVRLTLEESVADPFVLFSGVAAGHLLERLDTCERGRK